MDRVIYTAGNGAARALEHQAIVSNNMANVSTAGFRAQLAQYRSVDIQGPGLPTRATSVAVTPGTDMSAGPMQSTGRALDVAVQGDGWLAVLAQDGEAFTRAGSLHVMEDGLLRTATGQAVLSEDNQPIVIPPNAQLSFAADGTITALGAGDEANAIQLMGRLKLTNPPAATLLRGEDGLFRLAAAEGVEPGFVPASPEVRIAAGVIEGSNVNPTLAMTAMIANARLYEMQMQVVQHASTNAERANQLLSAGG